MRKSAWSFIVPVGIWCVLAMGGRSVPAYAQSLSGSDVLARSLAHHDPAGAWYGKAHRLQLRETRPNAADRTTEVVLDYPAGMFIMKMERDGHQLEMRMHESGSCMATMDGTAQIPDEAIQKYRMDCEGIAWWRDYQDYLYGLPMKLGDAGTLVGESAERTTFNERDVLSVKVTYAAEVGSDVWYFYFAPDTYALIGSRFYHDEAKNDGEYLFFDEEIEAGGIMLPRIRSWYVNSDGRFLGADYIEAYEQVTSGTH